MIRIFNQYVSAKALLLVVVEAVLISLSLLCAVRLRFWNDPVSFAAYTAMPEFAIQAAVVVICFQSCFYFNDLYDVTAGTRREEELVRLGQSIGAACLLLGLIYFLAPDLLVGRGVFFINVVLVVSCVVGSRLALDSLWRAARAQRLLILGTGGLAALVTRELRTREDLNLELVGFISADPAVAGDVYGYRVLGSATQVDEISRANGVNRIVVALEDRRGVLPIGCLVRLKAEGVYIEDAQSALAALAGRVWLGAVRPSWFVFSEGFRRTRFTNVLKRALDLFAGITGFVLTLPVMLVVAAAVRLDSKGPALYRQVRVGFKGRPFELLKFRSMQQDAEANGQAVWAAEDDPRVTRIGRIMRKFRLDELPQFLNVIRGDMSFVGPRPERPVFVDELRRQISYYDERHTVRPGITGWAQVQYRYGSSVEDACRKLEYDLFYLKNMSVLFDCAIIFKTIRIVLSGAGGR